MVVYNAGGFMVSKKIFVVKLISIYNFLFLILNSIVLKMLVYLKLVQVAILLFNNTLTTYKHLFCLIISHSDSNLSNKDLISFKLFEVFLT